jgi:hypothetical protein
MRGASVGITYLLLLLLFLLLLLLLLPLSHSHLLLPLLYRHEAQRFALTAPVAAEVSGRGVA